jgi:exopolysaccharide biosynthesis polyprenyl glycosylphosphotransferase
MTGFRQVTVAERLAGRRFRRVQHDQPRTDVAMLVEQAAPQAVRSRDKLFRRMLVGADIAAALLVALIAELVFGSKGPQWTLLLLAVITPFVNTGAGLYRRDELLLSKNTLDEAPEIFRASTLTVVFAYLAQSALLATPLGARVMALTLVSLTVVTIVLRLAGRTVARRLSPPERCLLVGETRLAHRLETQLQTTHTTNAELVGSVPLAAARFARNPRGEDAAPELPSVVNTLDVHRVVISGDGAPPEAVHEAIQSAKSLGVNVSLLPEMFEVVGSAVAFDYIGGIPVFGLRRFGLSRRARMVKRTFDLLGSAILLILLAPLLVTIAFAIRIDSKGPILFRQTRVGRDGRHFQMRKFRSMVADAEDRKADLWDLNEAAGGLFKIDDDPRTTTVGRFLRRTSLDELPQLLNVLWGEMSLVGPRPLVIEEDRRIEGFYRRRLRLTPGMTGPWQVAGSARVPLREMQSIDYLYVADWSLWGDVKILLRTFPVVLLRRGQ